MKSLMIISFLFVLVGCEKKAENSIELRTNHIPEEVKTKVNNDTLVFDFDYKNSPKDSTILYKTTDLKKDWLRIVGQDSNQLYLSRFNRDSLKNTLYVYNLKESFFSIHHEFPTHWQIHETYPSKNVVLVSSNDSLYFISLTDYKIKETYYLPNIDEICLTDEKQILFSDSKNYNTYLYSDTSKNMTGSLISKKNYGNFVYLYNQYHSSESYYSPTGRIISVCL